MKKLILSVALLLATSLTVSAEGENSNSINMVEAYDIEINVNSLARFLELSVDQRTPVEDVQKVFTESLRCAAVMGNDSRNRMVKNAIDYDLNHMRYILNDEQYKKYVRILNVTLTNRGIK